MSTLFRLLTIGGVLAIAPCLHALTVSATQTITGSPFYSFGSFWYGYLTFDWTVDRFDPSLGTLTGVSLLVSGQTKATVIEANPFGDPRQYTPALFNDASVFFEKNGVEFDVAHLQATGPEQTLSPFTRAEDFTTVFDVTLGMTSDAPGILNQFTGNSPEVLRIKQHIIGNTGWGGVYAEGSVTATLTYHYNVSEAGSTIPLFFSVFAALLFAARRDHRRKRSL